MLAAIYSSYDINLILFPRSVDIFIFCLCQGIRYLCEAVSEIENLKSFDRGSRKTVDISIPALCSSQRRGSRGKWWTLLLGTDGWTQRNSTKLCQAMDIRKNTFTVSVFEHCSRFPGEVAVVPCLLVFKVHFYNALNNILWILVSPEEVRQFCSVLFHSISWAGRL